MRSYRKLLVVLSSIVLCLFILGAAHAEMVYQEAPLLAERVARGQLPPVEERLPKNPLVWDNEWNHDIGNYGGTIRVSTFRFPEAQASIGLARITNDRQSFVPDMAEGYEWGPDKKSITFFLREGVRWSDGEPFTAHDFIFWWEDIVHSEYLPEPLGAQGFDTTTDSVELIDDYTIRFEFAQPNPQFLFTTRGFLGGQQGYQYRAKHYWSQFHPKYNPIEGMDPQEQMLEFADMVTSGIRGMLNHSLDFPVLWPWRPIEYVEEQHLLMERNPYFWSVDAEGNQLPYADYVQSYLMIDGDVEAIKVRIIAGEVDYERRTGTVPDIPLFRQYEEEAGIKLRFTLQPVGSIQGIYFGQNHPDPAKREVLQNVDFRRAMSLAIDRQTINETASLGVGTTGQGYSHPGMYNPEIDGSYADFDVERANALLDSIGMDQRDADGYRLLPNGETFTFSLLFTPGWLEGVTETAEIAAESWREVGIRANARPVDHSVRTQRRISGDVDAWMRPATGGLATYGLQYGFGVHLFAQHQWHWWRTRNWEESRRPSNIVPPEGALQEICEVYEQIILLEPFSDEYEVLVDRYREIMADQLWVIGVVQDTPKVLVSNKYLLNVPGEEHPQDANIILGTGDEEFWPRAFYYDQAYLDRQAQN